MDYELCSVPLDRIQTADRTFRITTTIDKSDLAPSIAAVGLLQPPTLIRGDHQFTPVSGFRRIAACRSINRSKISARLLPATYSRSDCVRLAIADNAVQRPLNIVEQSRAVTLIQAHCESLSNWVGFAKMMRLPASPSAMQRIQPVATMPQNLQHAILEGTLALPVAMHINRFSRDDAVALCDFFGILRAGINIQRELLGLIVDIANRDEIPVAQFIQAADMAAIVNDADAPRPQRVGRLRQLLKSRRFPQLSNAEETFKQQLKTLKLDPRIRLHPPPFFEGSAYRLTMTVESRRQLQALHMDIERLINHPALLPD